MLYATQDHPSTPLQTALVYVNTLMLEDVLAEPAWAVTLTPAGAG